MQKVALPLITIILTLALAACGAGSAGTGVEVHQVRMDAAAQGEDAGVYMAMHNHGSETDQLIGASSDSAESAQLQNGTEVVDVVPLYANTESEFTAESFHIVLVGLRQDLHAGDEIEVVLHFRDHPDLKITVPVQETSDHGHEEH